MNWLILSWALTASWIPLDNQSIVQQKPVANTVINSSGCYSISLEARAEIMNHLKIWGEVETYEKINPDTKLSFMPFRADYLVGIALYAKGIELGISHECDHGVESQSFYVPWYYLTQTRVYVKISGSTR